MSPLRNTPGRRAVVVWRTTNAMKELEHWRAGGLCPQAICLIQEGEFRWKESCWPGVLGFATELDVFPRKCTVVQTQINWGSPWLV